MVDEDKLKDLKERIQTANSNEILCVWPNAREACDKK